LWNVCLGLSQTMILLKSASGVTRISGVSQWHPVSFFVLFLKQSYIWPGACNPSTWETEARGSTPASKQTKRSRN
jgi:hypothetical protein